MTTLRIFILCGMWSFVAACTLQHSPTSVEQPTPFSGASAITRTATLRSTNTLGPSPLALSEPTQTLVVEPTPTLELSKPILISYSVGAGDGAEEDYICLRWRSAYSFVLYEDGQFVRFTDKGLMEKLLTRQEIDTLLTRIENTGYFQVQGTGELRENDPIYNIPQPIQVGDGAPVTRLSVKDKAIVMDAVPAQYLVEPIKQTLAIIQDYYPSGMFPYVPSRLGLWVWNVTGYEGQFPYATPIPPIIAWPLELPTLAALEKSTTYNYAILESKDIPLVFEQFSRFPGSHLFTEDNQTYYVIACPILP